MLSPTRPRGAHGGAPQASVPNVLGLGSRKRDFRTRDARGHPLLPAEVPAPVPQFPPPAPVVRGANVAAQLRRAKQRHVTISSDLVLGGGRRRRPETEELRGGGEQSRLAASFILPGEEGGVGGRESWQERPQGGRTQKGVSGGVRFILWGWMGWNQDPPSDALWFSAREGGCKQRAPVQKSRQGASRAVPAARGPVTPSPLRVP